MRHCGLGQEVAYCFNARKIQLVLVDQSNNNSGIDLKMDMVYS